MIENMRWLPPAPDDFRSRCRIAADADTLIALAGYALNANQLRSLANALGNIAQDQHPCLTPFRLGLLSNGTTDLLLPAIRATGLRYGLDIEIVAGAFGQIVGEAADPDATIHRASCDAVLIAADHHALPDQGFDELPDGTIVEMLGSARDFIHAHSTATVLLATIPMPGEAYFGSLDALLNGTPHTVVTAANAAIRNLVREVPGDILFDVAALAERVGSASWHDPVQWNVAKLSMGLDHIPLYADHLVRILAAMRGKSRKCLVLDLDNTCWGGVIGDDGLEGIVLGQGSALGEAFLEVQRAALRLRDRGIILAVCSKNDEAVARSVFRDHPEMLLREEHIAAFVANWTDKASNLESIAQQLSIGIDSLVLLDDNPAERAQVRQSLPQVAVPELPDDPSLYARTLLAGGYFEAVAFSDEDRQRGAQYQANLARESVKSAARDMGSYLRSLRMVATMGPFDAIARARVTQLINKSNQFNLTTRRYTEGEVAALEADPDVLTLQVRLQDCFGDNGIVSILIGRRQQDALFIDTWLMSCRVLGRELEWAVLNQLVVEARKTGAARLLGRFLSSGRNDMVRDHYAKLGFALVGEGDGGTDWSLDLAAFTPRPVPIETVAGRPERAAAT